MKKTAIVITAMMVMASFCIPAFASSGEGNQATYSNITSTNYGSSNIVEAIGAQVVGSDSYNTAKGIYVDASNGTAAKPVGNNEVKATGAQVTGSGNYNTAEMLRTAHENDFGGENVSATNTGSGVNSAGVGYKNTVTAIGAQVINSQEFNKATTKSDVSAFNEGNLGNTVSATGASIVKSGSYNTATMAPWGVSASNHGSGLEGTNSEGQAVVFTNTVAALGAEVNKSGSHNTANMSGYVSTSNWGTYGNAVSATGALVYNSDDNNTANAHSVRVDVVPSGSSMVGSFTGNFNSNSAVGIGAQVYSSGSNNTATGNIVFAWVGGAGNDVSAIGAQVMNSGSGNTASVLPWASSGPSNGSVTATVSGNNSRVIAIGAQVK